MCPQECTVNAAVHATPLQLSKGRLVRSFLHPTRGDAKNVHAWRYRYFLVARMPRSDEDELAYCQALIAADRSNFSAWHYRSVLLPRVHAARGHLSLEQLQLSGGAGQDVAQEGVVTDMQSPGTGASADTKAQRQEILHKDEQSSAEQRAKETKPAPTAAAGRAAPSIPLYELKAEFEFLHQVRAASLLAFRACNHMWICALSSRVHPYSELL